MSEKMMNAKIVREKGWLYYLDRDLNVCRAAMVHGNQRKEKGQKPELLLKTVLKREPNYLYYIDKAGDVSRVLAARGGSFRKGSKNRKKAKAKAVPKKNRASASVKKKAA
ncbi:MAG: hypothetical protein WCK49_02605 [Myxococcaceae bacterium]